MADFKGTPGDTLWREGGVRCVLVPAGAGMAADAYREALRFSRVLPTAGSRPLVAPTA